MATQGWTPKEDTASELALRTEATAYLVRLAKGEEQARGQLFEVLYADLKRMAAAQLRGERADHTLQPTALVHEAWLKLIDPKSEAVESKRHFMLLASQAMRRLLVDHARSRKRDKRGGGRRRVELSEQISPADDNDDPFGIEEVHRALEHLEERSERYARIVELRFFCGLSREEAAAALGISRATITREWRIAKALLMNALQEAATKPEPE